MWEFAWSDSGVARSQQDFLLGTGLPYLVLSNHSTHTTISVEEYVGVVTPPPPLSTSPAIGFNVVIIT